MTSPRYLAHSLNRPRSILGYTDSLIRPTRHFSQFVEGSCNFFVGSRVTKLLTLDLLLSSIYLFREIIRSLFLGITATKLDRLILKSELLRCFVLYHVFIFLFFKFTTTLAYVCITQSILFC